MKDQCVEITRSKSTRNEKLNTMREYLQAYVLYILQDQGFFQSTAFVGGTCLRFLYDLPRYSEDLDFSKVGNPKISFNDLTIKLEKELNLAGYNVSLSCKEQKTVQSAFIRFENIMQEVSLTSDPKQKFSVKIEIDTNPPLGAETTTKLINKYFPIAFLSYDLSSLFTGKYHALLSRKYTKGRDLYDLGWYLSRFKDCQPNFKFLSNALTQTGWKRPMPDETNWRNLLYEVVNKLNWKQVNEDVVNFLQHPSDMKALTKENVLALIKPK